MALGLVIAYSKANNTMIKSYINLGVNNKNKILGLRLILVYIHIYLKLWLKNHVHINNLKIFKLSLNEYRLMVNCSSSKRKLLVQIRLFIYRFSIMIR